MKNFATVILMMFVSCYAVAQTTAVDWYNKGKKYQDDKNYKLAVVAFTKSIQLDKNYFDAWYELGWCQNELKNYDDAILSLIKASQLKPGMSKVYFELAYAYDKKGSMADAIFYYRKCISISPANASAWYNKGYCENQTGLYDSAYVSCKNAIQYKAGYRQAYDELGFACYKLKRSYEAIDAYRMSITIDSGSRTPFLGIGDVYKSNLKIVDSALFYFSRAYAKDANHPKAPYSIGWCYNEKSMFNDAVAWLKKCLFIDAGYSSAKTELGYAYYKLKNYDDALVQFNAIISANSKDELSRYYAGFCYYLKEDQYNLKKMIEQLQLINTTTSLQYADTLKKYIK